MAIVITEIAELLLKGIISGIGGFIGGKMLSSIFKSTVPSYFTEVYKVIADITKEELSTNTIAQIDGEINGLVQWIENQYNPRKSAGAVKTELYNMLLPQVNDVAVHMVAVLQEKEFASSALSVFIIGASIHLALLQELATVDPDVSHADKSSYVATIQKYANEYREYVERVYCNIATARINFISPVSRKCFAAGGIGGLAASHSYLEWKDSLTGKEFSESGHTSYTGEEPSEEEFKDAEKTRAEYIEKVISNLRKETNDPVTAAATWRKLVEQPLPSILTAK